MYLHSMVIGVFFHTGSEMLQVPYAVDLNIYISLAWILVTFSNSLFQN